MVVPNLNYLMLCFLNITQILHVVSDERPIYQADVITDIEGQNTQDLTEEHIRAHLHRNDRVSLTITRLEQYDPETGNWNPTRTSIPHQDTSAEIDEHTN